MAKKAKDETVEVIKTRLTASVHRFQIVADLIKANVKATTICICVWIIIRGVVDLAGMEKGSLSALANVIKALDLSTWIAYIATGGSLVAWKAERTGKKRAIRELGELRRKQEVNDPNASRSGLDAFGNTPRD